MAARAPVGVVLRREPTNAVCSLLWDRAKDSFQIGQWVRHRIYERRSDISPDGRYLIYFARNSAWQSETKGTWTAVSHAPWLKAVVLFGKGDCWNGGGMFTSEKRYWLNAGCGHFLIRDSGEVEQDLDYKPAGSYGGECPSVYYRRLQRDGWVLKDNLNAGMGECVHGLRKGAAARLDLAQVRARGGRAASTGTRLLLGRARNRATGTRTEVAAAELERAELDGETLVWAEGVFTGRPSVARRWARPVCCSISTGWSWSR